MQHLETLAEGTPAELLLQTITRLEPVSLDEARKRAGMAMETADAALDELLDQQAVISLDRQLISFTGWQQLNNRLLDNLTQFHNQYPLRVGMSREELRSRLKIKPAVFQAMMEQAERAGKVVEAGPLVHLPGHEVRFNAQQQTAVDQTLAEFANSGVNSPPLNEVKAKLGEDVLNALFDLDELIQIGSNVVYTQETYQEIIDKITAYLQENGRINAAQLRDLLDSSRKYAISWLEHLDQRKITRRIGDERELF